MSGTQNFYNSTLHNMEKHVDEQASISGQRVPYHLQYIRNTQKSELLATQNNEESADEINLSGADNTND